MANKDFIIKKGVIVTDDIQINSSEDIIKLDISAWGSNSEQKIIINSFNSTIGDHLLVKAAGNGASHGAIVIADNVFSYGRTTSGGQVDASLTSPLPDALSFTVDWQGNAIFAGSITSDDNIYAADTNLSTSPSFAFKGHTDTGIGVQADGSNDRLNLIVDGVTRAYANISGFFSNGNLYSANGGQFRNFGGTWKATTGVTGNGFEFINSVDGTAMTLSADGDMIVYGNLEVRGTQTILNTATLSVDDLNITIADGAANATAANGAGLTVDGANATITYTSAQDEWNFNKNVVIGGKDTTASFPLMIRSDSAHKGIHIEENSGAESWQMGVNATGDLNFYNSGSNTASITFEDSGDVGIGVPAPTAKLDVSSSTADNVVARFTGTYTASGDVALSEWQRNGGAVKANFVYVDSTTDMEFGTTTSHGLSIKTGNTRRLTINSSGNATFTGTVTADTHFTSSDSNATLSSSGSGGYVYLRPNGSGTTTGETRIDTNGQLNVNSTSTSHGLEISQSTNTGYAPASILLNATQSTARGGGIYSYNTQSDNGWYSGSLYNNTNLWAVTFLNGTSFNSAIAQTTHAIFTVDGPNGRVGIGLTNPSEKLEVSGKIKASGQIRAGSYLESFPSFSFANDTDTGMFSDTADQLEFSTGGSSKLTINSSGSVGIGETNIDAKLHLTSASAGLINQKFESATSAAWRLGIPASQTYFAFDNANDNLSSPKVVIGSTGNVGIGTDSPSHLLELSNTMASSPKHIFYKMTGTNIAGGGAGIKFDSSATNNDASVYWSGIQGIRTTSNDGSNELRFWTTSAAEAPGGTQGAPSQRMVISETGKVGIGTTSPNRQLEVEGQGVLRLNATGSNTDPGIDFNTSSVNDMQIRYRGGSDKLAIYSYGTSSDVLTIQKADGNVGIGTINPKSLLNVRGTGADGGILTLENDSTSLVADRKVGQIHFYSNDGSTNGTGVRADIKAIAENSIGSAIGLAFSTSGAGSATAVEALRLDASQNATFAGDVSLTTGNLAVEGTIELGNNYIIPSTNGTAGQVLKYPTAGSSTLVWSDMDTGAVTSISNNANNRILTATSGATINGESNLTFDGSTLVLTGDMTVTDSTNDPFIRFQTSEQEYVVRIDNSDSDKFQIRDVTNSGTRLSINTSGDTTLSGNLYLSDSSTNYLSMHAGDMLKHNTGNGYIEFGPANTGHAHIQTDRSNFYFNVGLQVDTGIIASYNEDLVLQRARSTAYELTLKTTGLELDQGKMHLKSGLYSADNTDVKLRQYYLATGDAGGSFLLGKIENSANADGGVEGIVRFAHDYGSSTNNCAIHFHFAQRTGTARGTWWYEHDDQDGSADRVHVRLIDDGAGNMYVWATCVDFAKTYIETTWRQSTSASDSGTLTAGTLTTGTTLFDTANDPTSQMHIGSLFAHDASTISGNCTFNGSANQMSGTMEFSGDVLFDGTNTGGISFDISDDAFEFSDSARAKFGNSSDLQIYHDGSNSYIHDNGTGNLKVRTSSFNLMNAANNELMINASENGAVTLYYDNAPKIATTSSGVNVTGLLSATTKSFDIEHPSKKGDWRLRYGSLEGPENGVYVRGKSKEKVILLPDYWVDLVHEDSITVQLTAIGGGQNLYVEDIKNNKVFVNGENYFYYIQAERKDVDKLEVEYERT